MILGNGVIIESGAAVEGKMLGEGTIVEVGAVVGRGSVVGKVGTGLFFLGAILKRFGPLFLLQSRKVVAILLSIPYANSHIQQLALQGLPTLLYTSI